MITIRDAIQNDIPSIVEFNRQLALESEGKNLDSEILTSGVRRALASPTLCRYYVAEMDGEVIGQTMLTFELTDWRDGLVYWIQSVFVQPKFRGHGVFKQLYQHVVKEANRSGDARSIRLYVEKDNAKAIAVYERLGMERAHFHIYETAN